MRFLSWKSVGVLCLFGSLCAAQTSAPTLQRMAANAGYIFAGIVTGVSLVPPSRPDEVETVRITFRIDQGVRGVRSRQSLTIREWAGLWNAGERYQVGQRVVLMLHSPSKVGLTSPVGGSAGRFPLDRAGNLALPPQQTEILATDPAIGPWLQSRRRTSGRDFARRLGRVSKE